MKSTLLTIMVVALTFVLALGYVASVSAWGGKKADITGKVEHGKIVTDNGKEYVLAHNAKADELMSGHMCHQVEVKGTVSHEKGQDTIKVSSFKHLAEGTC